MQRKVQIRIWLRQQVLIQPYTITLYTYVTKNKVYALVYILLFHRAPSSLHNNC